MKLSIKKRPPGEDMGTILARDKFASEKKLELMKKEKEEKEQEGCTFSPNILRTTSTKDVQPPYSLTNVSLGDHMQNRSMRKNDIKNGS